MIALPVMAMVREMEREGKRCGERADMRGVERGVGMGEGGGSGPHSTRRHFNDLLLKCQASILLTTTTDRRW